MTGFKNISRGLCLRLAEASAGEQLLVDDYKEAFATSED
jgi:hypothetical protein